MARVIAGAGTGRALALHGADVLNLWRPSDFESDLLYATANVGVRSARSIRGSTDGARAAARAAGAAPTCSMPTGAHGFLDRYGLSPQQAAALRPGIVHASVSLHGQTGPVGRPPGLRPVGRLRDRASMTLEGDTARAEAAADPGRQRLPGAPGC